MAKTSNNKPTVEFIDAANPTHTNSVIIDGDTIPVSTAEPVTDAGPELINGYESIEPGTAGSGTGKRRGRPPGSVNTATRTKTPTKGDLSDVRDILVSMHMMAAAFFDTPELVIAPDEARALSAAIATVAAQYNTIVNPKIMAWVGLIMVTGNVYGTRAIAIHRRRKTEAETVPGPKVTPIKAKSAPAAQLQPNGAQPARGPGMTPADMYGPGFVSDAGLSFGLAE